MHNLLDEIWRRATFKRNQRVIYTCLFGYSEAFMNRPVIRDGNTAYVCFTDDRTLKSDDWSFVYIDPAKYGPVKTSKLVKTSPHLFLSEYSSSLYVDNTVRLNRPPCEIWSFLSEVKPFVVFRHPWWDCPYVESEKLVETGYLTQEQVDRQMSNYRADGFPKNSGMFHAAVLLRMHNNPAVKKISEEWFEEINKYNYRDQIPLSFLVWKTGFPLGFFPGLAIDDDLVMWPNFVGHRLPRAFNDDVYLGLHPDVASGTMNPREHFLKIGADEGRAWQ